MKEVINKWQTEEAADSNPYKVAKHDFDQLPSDAFIDLGWSWSD